MFESSHKPVQDMHLASLHRDDLLPQPPTGLRRGLLLAFAAHAVLIAVLAFGVSWNSSEPTGVQAELWAAVPQVAAPKAAAPEPAPEPPPPKPEPRRAVEPPAPVKPAPDPQIAIEREKQRKEKLREDKEKADRDEAKQDKLARDKKERDEKLRDDKKAAEQKVADQKALDQKKKQQEQARAEAIRADQLARTQKMLGADNGTPGGNADRTASASPGYGGKIRAVVRPNIISTVEINGNPEAVVEVRLGPDGTITGRRLKKSSGVPQWDEIVLRAIDKTERLPLDNGRVITPIDLGFRPQD